MPAMPAPHVPVLIGPLIDAVRPVEGAWIDGTLGAGGYARALLDAGAAHVTGIDRDADALATAQALSVPYLDRLTLLHVRFGDLDAHADAADGVVLDLGVSSMQLDQAARGFSFRLDGPLDMRMGADGPSAADLIAEADEGELADILRAYGEERAARRIARAIVRARVEGPIETTARLAEIVARQLPRPKPGQAHPATRAFQALRIAVNDELAELARGLAAAERVLRPGGWLAVVTFHSLEDRVVKRFLQARSDAAPRGSRHAPAEATPPATFEIATRGIAADEAEIATNPRARSARLRVGRRTDAVARPLDPAALGLPTLTLRDMP